MEKNKINNQTDPLNKTKKIINIQVNKWLFFLLFIGYLFLVYSAINLSFSNTSTTEALGVGLTMFFIALIFVFLVIVAFVGVILMQLKNKKAVNLDPKKMLIFVLMQIFVFLFQFGISNINYSADNVLAVFLVEISNVINISFLFSLPIFFTIIFIETFFIKVSYKITKLLIIFIVFAFLYNFVSLFGNIRNNVMTAWGIKNKSIETCLAISDNVWDSRNCLQGVLKKEVCSLIPESYSRNCIYYYLNRDFCSSLSEFSVAESNCNKYIEELYSKEFCEKIKPEHDAHYYACQDNYYNK